MTNLRLLLGLFSILVVGYSFPVCGQTPGPLATCVGDCNGDGTVTADELTQMVNLQRGGRSQCSMPPGADQTANIAAAVNNALNGCPVGTMYTRYAPFRIDAHGVIRTGARCDDGDLPTGGGYFLNTLDSIGEPLPDAELNVEVFANYPLTNGYSEPTGWDIGVRNKADVSREGYAYALCVRTSEGVRLKSYVPPSTD